MNSEKCPKCGVSFQGAEIPETDKEFFGQSTHFSRLIGIDGSHMGIYDGVVAHKCPDCDFVFPRSDCDWGMLLFEKYQTAIKGYGRY
jgi:hypothetical protein